MLGNCLAMKDMTFTIICKNKAQEKCASENCVHPILKKRLQIIDFNLGSNKDTSATKNV